MIPVLVATVQTRGRNALRNELLEPHKNHSHAPQELRILRAIPADFWNAELSAEAETRRTD